ncbi:MAG: putative bifunctional diguanylate cyclase/phosphodiesterase [Thiomonas sp.]
MMTATLFASPDPIRKTSSTLVIRLWILGLAVLLAILGVSGYYQWAAVQRNVLTLLQAYASEYTVNLRNKLSAYARQLELTEHALQQASSSPEIPILLGLLHQRSTYRNVVLLDARGRPLVTVGAPWVYPSLNPQLTPQTRAAWRGCPEQANDCLTAPAPAPHHPGVFLAANIHRLLHPIGQASWIVLVHPNIDPSILRDVRSPYPATVIVVLREGDHLLQMRNPSPTQLGYGYAQSGILARSLNQHPDALEGTYVGMPTASRGPVFGTFLRVPEWPLIVGVSLPYAALVSTWLRNMAPMAAILVVMGLLGTALLRLGLNRLREAETAREASQAALQAQIQTSQNQAITDPLSGLLNRRGIEQALSDEFARAQRTGEGFGLVLMDLDHFKLVNDSYGHPAGDSVLLRVADLLREHVRQGDAVARWGGEEFLILLPRQNLERTHQTAQRLREAVAVMRVTHGPHTIHVTASFGIAAWSGAACTPAQLIGRLDSLLYDAKRSGRNRVKGLEAQESHILSHGARIQSALDGGRVRAAYQPLVDLRTGETVGQEALARMLTPSGEVMPAADFIGAAHRLRLEHRIDAVVSHLALEHCGKRTRGGGLPMKHLINCSADFLSRPDCVQGLLDAARSQCVACGQTQGSAKPVVIEITERQILGHPKETLAMLQPLLDFGFELAVDDFGSGYSSFLYLLNLPVKYLKIEMELVQRAVTDPKARVMVKSIQAMARELGILTIAEGIETPEMRDLMGSIGVDWGQGYLWGRPELDAASEIPTHACDVLPRSGVSPWAPA